MAASFDLFRNPFILLGVDASASASEVAEAYEDAIADGDVPQAELAAARQTILAPSLRLIAEVSCLLDTAKKDWRPILTALKSTQGLPHLRRAFANVAPLSRSNLLAHISARTPPDAPTLIAWVDAQSKVETDLIHREVGRLRDLARVARPERAMIASALDQLKENHTRAIFEAFASPADAIEAVTTCTTEAIAAGDEKRVDVLGTLLRAYSAYIGQELTLRRERVKSTGNALQADPSDSSNLALFIDALKFWNIASQPIQLLEFHKGRDEPNAQEVFWEARGLAIDIANNLSRFDLALSITEACAHIFEKLPRAASHLAEDGEALKKRVVTSKVEPLAEALLEVENDLPKIRSDLLRGGFGPTAVGSAKFLRDAFLTAVNASKATEAVELPWLLIRSLAVKLNNEADAPDSALALVRGLVALGGELAPSDEMRSRLREDERAIERNKLEKELIAHLTAKRLGPALKIVDNLLQDYKSPEERATLHKLKSDVQRQRYGQYFRWALWPAIGLFVIVISNVDRKADTSPPPRPSPYAPETQTPSVAARNPSEEMPPIGRDRLLEEASVRYCMFQKVRLEAIRQRIGENFEVDEFNKVIDDYNSRCGNYRYRTRDHSAVEAELVLKRFSLEADADRIVKAWRARSLPAQLPSPAPRNVTAPTPQQSAPIEVTGPSVDDGQKFDLLKLSDATRVQARLMELGFLKGPADGTWGAQSRAALRAFRAVSGLPPSDVWDKSTADQLFSPTAARGTNTQKPSRPLPDFSFEPPKGATMHPLNKEDAVRIHGKLRELGYYQTKNNVLWSTASRAALRDFKSATDLPADDEWDAATEQKLFNNSSARASNPEEENFEASFAGVWATELSACPGSGVTTDMIPVRISRKRAEAGSAGCDFLSARAEGDRWAIRAQCRADDKNWIANISLSRQGEQLKWTSERGTTTYLRCGS